MKVSETSGPAGCYWGECTSHAGKGGARGSIFISVELIRKSAGCWQELRLGMDVVDRDVPARV